jgi:hypothetical protein
MLLFWNNKGEVLSSNEKNATNAIPEEEELHFSISSAASNVLKAFWLLASSIASSAESWLDAVQKI